MEQTEPIGENAAEPDSSTDNRRQDGVEAEVHHPAEEMQNAVNEPPEASGHIPEEKTGRSRKSSCYAGRDGVAASSASSGSQSAD